MRLLTSLLMGLLAATAEAAPKPVGPPLVVITSGTAQAQINGAGGLYVLYGVNTGTLTVRGQTTLNGSLIVNGGINGGAGLTVSSLTLTGTGNNFFDLGLSSGMRFFAPNTGIVWADGSVSTSASPNAGAGGTTIIVPAGTISPYGSALVPAGWLECDGSAVSRVTYSVLYTAIGDTWGEGNGSTTFNLPDLRGNFLRGFNDGAGVTAYVGDPGAAGRVAIMPGGNTGDDVGSYQIDDFASHTHSANSQSPPNIFGGGGSGFGAGGNVSATGGLETRPKNAAVMFIISLGQSVTYGINDPNIYSALAALAADKVDRAGDTMTGPLAVTATGAGVYGVTLSTGLNFLTPATGIVWADGSVSTTASAGGGGGGPVPADLAVDTLTFTYVMKSSEAIPTIKIGDLDQFGRRQIMNAKPLSVLRLGWNPSDGDPYAEESEGIVVNGPVVNSVARIKPNRFGLTEAWDTARYYFRADNTTLKYGNYGEPQQLYVNRVTSFTGIGTQTKDVTDLNILGVQGPTRLETGAGQSTTLKVVSANANPVGMDVSWGAGAPTIQNSIVSGSGLPGVSRGFALSTGPKTTMTDMSDMLGSLGHTASGGVCLAVNPYRDQDFCMEDNGNIFIDTDLNRGTDQEGALIINSRFTVMNSSLAVPGIEAGGGININAAGGSPQLITGGRSAPMTELTNSDILVINSPTTKHHGKISVWTSQEVGADQTRAGAYDYFALRGSTGSPLQMNPGDWIGQSNYLTWTGPTLQSRPSVRTLASMPSTCYDGLTCPGQYQIQVSTGGPSTRVAVTVTSTTEVNFASAVYVSGNNGSGYSVEASSGIKARYIDLAGGRVSGPGMLSYTPKISSVQADGAVDVNFQNYVGIATVTVAGWTGGRPMRIDWSADLENQDQLSGHEYTCWLLQDDAYLQQKKVGIQIVTVTLNAVKTHIGGSYYSPASPSGTANFHVDCQTNATSAQGQSAYFMDIVATEY
jgi:hypothetical protein